MSYLRHRLGVGNIRQPRAQNVDEGGRHGPREVERGGAVDEDSAELALGCNSIDILGASHNLSCFMLETCLNLYWG